ncbi:hypothetical protein B1B_15707, partial [mine drainage metagenome]
MDMLSIVAEGDYTGAIRTLLNRKAAQAANRDHAPELIHQPHNSSVATAEAQTSFETGEEMQHAHAERYPTVRWSWPYKGYVVVGAPDGLTEAFPYEFKFHKRWSDKSVVGDHDQANLYAHFFGTDTYVLDVLSGSGFRKKWREPVDHVRAEKRLEDAISLYDL